MIPKIVLDAIETGGTEFEKERARECFKVLSVEGQQIVIDFIENLFLGKRKLCNETLAWASNINEADKK